MLFFLNFVSQIQAESLNKLIPQLNIYPEPAIRGFGFSRHNNDFSVRVRLLPNGDWKELYEYKTFVNSSQERSDFEESSFVVFDFSGRVMLEITSNTTPIREVLVRPQSKVIEYSKSHSIITMILDKPEKLSLEINSDRYRNLQIFANTIVDPPPPGALEYLPGIYENDIFPSNGDTIYFHPGAILMGKISIIDKENVVILGRGLIDLMDLRKQYNSETDWIPPYEYKQGIEIRRSKNIKIQGITINDPQTYAIEIVESDSITINNVNVFTRVLWGDGINMVGTSNISINDCYLRTSDDSIAIYASRVRNWRWQNKDAINISITNSILYADAAHPIEIGWHGNQGKNGSADPNTPVTGNLIYNLRFEEIDILEHNQPNDKDSAYQGAISINCGDENKCINFRFKNVRIEDFTEGKLFTIKVEPAGFGAAVTSGEKVKDIIFENLTYNGYGEEPSIISGLSCDRFVDGVHFQDFTVNGQLIKDLSDYFITTNNFAYNITFQEANNFSINLPDGIYKLKNIQTKKYLQKTDEKSTINPSHNFVITFPEQNTDNQLWQISRITGTGHYNIKNILDNKYLTNSEEQYNYDCKGRYTMTTSKQNSTSQEWKIVKNSSGYYNINNVYTRAYLHNSIEPYINNPSGNYSINYPKNMHLNQNWQIIENFSKMEERRSLKREDFKLYPNPISDYLNIEPQIEIASTKIQILDMQGRVILFTKIFGETKQYVGNLKPGFYIISIENIHGSPHLFKFIKK